MLDIDILNPSEIDRATNIFHRDGFVAVKDTMTPEQFALLKVGCDRIIQKQTDADPERKGNRGSFRYSFGNQIMHQEWQTLIELPSVLAILDKIWSSKSYICIGGGGDYSLPGAEIQPLHKDMGDFFQDPHGTVTFHDPIAPFIVVNVLMVDFTKENGAIRFVPCTQRSRHPIPSVADEPRWMKDSIVCAPAGTAIIRDVRCWHAGTANNSKMIRPMTSIAYTAPWFWMGGFDRGLPKADYQRLTPRGKDLCRFIVNQD